MKLDNLMSNTVKNYTVSENGLIHLHRISRPERKLVRIKQSEIARRISAGFYGEKLTELSDQATFEGIFNKKDTPKKKKAKKGKKNKKIRKRPKKSRRQSKRKSMLIPSSWIPVAEKRTSVDCYREFLKTP